jgi:hypothetical protein
MKEIIREELEQYYIIENHKRVDTAEHFGVKPYIIDNYAKQWGLKKVSSQERISQIKKYLTQPVLQDLYEKQGKTYSDICTEFKIKGDDLDVLLRDYGLGKRRMLERLKMHISKEDIEKAYIQENMEAVDVAKLLNMSVQNFYRLVSFYGIKKSKYEVSKNIQKTCIQRYGVDNIRKASSFKEYVKQTKEKKYGDKNYNNRLQAQQTDMSRYGAEHHNQNSVIKSKIVQHRWENKSREELDQIQDKTIQTNLERYGVMYPVQNATLDSKDSKPNLHFQEILTRYNLSFSREFSILNRTYDFKVDNTLIEIDPYPTHNSTWGIKGGTGKSRTYHQEKSQLARENGYTCIHIFDWDDQEKIVRMLLRKKRVFARKCEITEITQREANAFLNQYHLQGGAKMQTVCLALKSEGQVMEIMTFGKPRFNKHYQWELIRLCTQTGYLVIGGAERLFKHFLEKYSPDSIISYCDAAKFSGHVYKNLGFTLKSEGAPSRHWFSPDLNMHITDNGLRMKGFDKLLGNRFGTFGKGTSNDTLMRTHGFVEVYDAGQAVFTWNK